MSSSSPEQNDRIRIIKKVTPTNDYLTDLKEKGYAIVPNVISEEQLEIHRKQMWTLLYHISSNWEKPIQEGDIESYRGYYGLLPLHSMLLQHWEVGQSQLSWDIRQNQNVIDVFSKLWGTDDLLVSYDGMSIHFPPEETGRGWQGKQWHHTDQSFTVQGYKCVQGQVNIFDVNEGDATLVVLEKSHLLHHKIGEVFGVNKKDNFSRLSDEQLKYYLDNGCTERRIVCPAGSLVLWDSRTIHYGSEPVKGREKKNMRCTVYVCYLPRSGCSAIQLNKRIKYFEEMRMTTHWPYPVKVFSLKPNTYGKPLPPVVPLPYPILNETGYRLVGY
jgi:ectoine hydroxylase-related dioxygenase (phytanoyl-CoA dioxygenase family)